MEFAPQRPHTDAHDKNSMYSYLYWSELGLNRHHAWINDINFTHNNPRWSHYTKLKLHVKITHCQYFLRPPQNFTNHVFRGAHVLLRGAELPRSLHPGPWSDPHAQKKTWRQMQRTVFVEIKMDAARVSMCLAIFKLMCNRSLNNKVIVLSIYCLPLWF